LLDRSIPSNGTCCDILPVDGGPSHERIVLAGAHHFLYMFFDLA